MGGGMMGQGMMGGGMMQGIMMQGGMMQGMGGQMMGQGMMGAGPGGFVEGRIAFLEAELQPTDNQRPLFDAYAATLGAQAESMQSMDGQTMSGDHAWTYPERLDHMARAMAARAEPLAALAEAASPLYHALDEQQRAVFDQLMGMM